MHTKLRMSEYPQNILNFFYKSFKNSQIRAFKELAQIFYENIQDKSSLEYFVKMGYGKSYKNNS
jgi:hypothetical protein